VRPFDPKQYLAEVLGPARDAAVLPSLYDRYLLDPDDEDEAAIGARLDEVKRLWDKQSEHPRYGSMIRSFSEQHAEAKLTLGDAQQRARLAEEQRGERRAAEEERRREVERWEKMLADVIAAGGIDPARRAQLEKLAARAGIEADVAAAKLDAAPQVAAPEVLDAGVRRDIASKLTALAQGVGEPRLGLSLYHALNLEISDGPEEVRARREEKVEEVNLTAATSLKASWNAVLALIKLHLLDVDPGAYVNGLAAAAREALEPEAFSAFADGVVDKFEAEQLQRQALQLGLTPELAQRVIADLARENGAVLHAGGAVDYVACPVCNRPHPRGAGDEHCRQCGRDLYLDCHACGARNDATSGRCSACGADLHRYAEAVRSLQRLWPLLREGKVAQAQQTLAAAVEVLGSDAPEANDGARAVAAAVGKANRGWTEVRQARAETRLFAARELLAALAGSARDLPGPGGELPVQAQAAVAAQIDEAQARFEAVRGLQGDAYEQGLVDVLAIAADHAEAVGELDRLPPAPPAQVEAAPNGPSMLVRWAPSSTAGVRYSVSRITVPEGVESRIGEADEPRIEDLGAPPGTVVRYAVSAVRGRAQSAPVRSEPSQAAVEVAHLAVASGDGEVRLSWAPLSGGGRVVVNRRQQEGAEAVPIEADAAGTVDRSVANGQSYVYTVLVEYPGPGGAVSRTPGLTGLAQPVERPRPLSGLRFEAGPSGVRIGFEAPAAGTVVVLRCAVDHELALGAELDPSRLDELGERLAIEGGAAIDPCPQGGTCFYLPVTLAGNIAIAGAAARHLSLAEVTNARAVPSGRDFLVTWAWPETVRLARVVWRHDRRPDGPDDPEARSLDISRGEYKDRGGCTIEAGAERSIFVAVFSAARADGEVVVGMTAGKGARVALRSEHKTEVRYSVRRVGRLAKRLEVEISEPAQGDLPELVLIGREGDILPRSASDGQVLARLGGDGPRCSTLELRGLARPLALRMFLGSASASASHVLLDPMADDLLVG
jgi:hypothetical protein